MIAKRTSCRHSQKWGCLVLQDVKEGNRTVEQSMHREESSLGNPVSLARQLEMLDYGLVTDAQYLRDFPVALPSRRPRQAFALPVREAGYRRRWNSQALDPPCRLECKRPGKLRKGEPFGP